MNPFANRVLLGIALVLVTVDVAWARLGHFDVFWDGYTAAGIMALALLALGVFYSHQRPDPNLAAMLFGASFLCVFSTGANFLNYLLLTVAGPRIDMTLAHIDRMIGFNWPATIEFAAAHPTLNAALHFAYMSSLPQVAALIVCLGLFRQPDRIYGFCFALACGASIAIGFWIFFPSVGALTVYHVPYDIAQKVNIALDGHEGRKLVAMLAHGPGRLVPIDVEGLIAFPSFHTVMALLTMWYARELPVLRWLAVGLNLLVIASTPIHGGHHLVDIFGGIATGAAAIFLSSRIMMAARSRRDSALPSAAGAHALPSV